MRASLGIVPVAATLLYASSPSTAAAHHSFAALFRMDTVTEIEGRVTEVHWVNPHIKIDVAGNDGQSWEVEAGPVNLLSRMGIEKAMVPVGATIKFRGNPGRRNARHLWVSNILLADNTELLAAPGARPYWGDKTVGDASAFFAAGDPALPAGAERSFFRIWSPLISAFPRPRATPALTAEGQRAQTRYEGGEQAVPDCEVPGMPFAMMSPYPIELVRQGDRLVIRGEAYDLTRSVHLGAPAATPEPSPLGSSIGRVTADEIVIETSGIDYHSYGDRGPAQSNRSHVVERFTLSADGLTLDYEITVTDPVMLAEPWAWGGSFVYREGAELRAWNCGADRG
ncbi:MAG TPA: DUF6152 family protein [Gammaproteobacteria bacterium]|nr:DUF6152 family protein [Gammaproteobacteria bacterium]